MAINFPIPSYVGELYTFNQTTWEWSGEYWGVYSAQTGYVTSAVTVGSGYSDISGLTNNTLYLKSFSGNNITITDSGNTLTFGVETYSAGIIINSSGWTSTGTGQINLPQVDVALYDNSQFLGTVKLYTILSGTTNSGGIPPLTNNDTNYIVIEYNGGSPKYNVLNNDSTINDSDVVLYMIVYRANNFIHTLDFGNQGAGLPNKLNDRIIMTDRFAWESGLSLGLSGTTGVVTLTSGVAWNGTNRQTLASVNSQDDTFFKNFHSGGTWVYTTTGDALNNTFYDNGTNPVLATAGKYLVNWYFRGQEVNDHLYEVYGTDEYDSVSEAQLSVEPILPELITSHAFLTGRIIVQVSATTGYVESAFVRVFQSTTVTEHNDLLGLQGGLGGQYYHLNSNQYNNLPLLNSNNSFQGGLTANTISATTYQNLPTYTGNTSASCITDLYVTNLNSCSPLHIQPTNSGNVYIGENGGVNVGIGTSLPTEKLEVNGNIKTSQGVIVDGSTFNGVRFNSSGFSRISILNSYKFDGVFTEGFKFHNISYDFLNYDQSGLNGDNFQIANSFIKGKNAGISDTTKYFGINVTGTPTSMLHVVGPNSSSPTALFESKATNDTAYTVRAIATTTNTQSNVGLYSYVSGGFANLGLWVEEGLSCFGPFNPDSKVYIKGIDSSTSNYGLKVQNSSGTNNFVVRNDGNVGIGTSTPSETLEVNGKTKTTNFQMTSGATNGYVLTSDASGNASWTPQSGITGGTDTYVTGVTYSANTLTVSQNGGQSPINTTIGLNIKSGTVASGSFAGTPKTATVTFTTAYPNTSYSIGITGSDNRTFTYSNKTTTGFTINANSNTNLTGNVDWQTISIGES